MNTSKPLADAIALHRRNTRDYEESRELMRKAVRAHLREVTSERGTLTPLAKKLGMSMVCLANIKASCGVPSLKWAEKLLKATI